MSLVRKAKRAIGLSRNLLDAPDRLQSRFGCIERELEAHKVLQARIMIRLNQELSSSNLQDFEFKAFSQFGEDGIIQRLIQLVPVKHKTFIEFGVEDFHESNCRFLMMNDNWSGFVIDGSEENIERIKAADFYWRHELTALRRFVTRENVSETLRSSGFDPDLGILSIDLDGVDYYLWEELDWLRPRIMIAEYNSVFGPDRAITVPYDPAFVRHDKHHSGLYFGCSLGALHHLATSRGYSLVGSTSDGVNAFFVRNDVMPKGLRALTVAEAYVASKFRESRHPDLSLSYVGGTDRIELIRGLPVVNVLTRAEEKL